MDKLTFQNGTTKVPEGLANTLPMFRLLGDSLPEGFKTPEAKRTISKIFYGGILLTFGILFFKNYEKLLDFAAKGTLFICFMIVMFVLVALFPVITRFLSDLGRSMIKRADNKVKDEFAIEWIDLAIEEMEEGLIISGKRITEVEAVKLNAQTDAEDEKKLAEENYELFEEAMKKVREYEVKEKEARQKFQDNPNDSSLEESADDYLRKKSEAQTDASVFQSKSISSENLSKKFAQHANQFGKALNILKNNESWAKQRIDIMRSSASILKREFNAASKMNEASEGISDIFATQNREDVKVAFTAVQYKINSELASFKRNLEAVNQNKLGYMHPVKSMEQLEAFSQQMKTGRLTALNVSKIADANHKLTKDEIVDPKMRIFND